MIGKRNRKIEELERRLAEYFNKIYLVADPAEGVNLSPIDIYTMIVVTDSTGHPLNKDFFSNLRAHFSRSVLVCLVDQIPRKQKKPCAVQVYFFWDLIISLVSTIEVF